MLTSDDRVEQDGLDDYDRARASDMDESRPIYSSPVLVSCNASDDEDIKPTESED